MFDIPPTEEPIGMHSQSIASHSEFGNPSEIDNCSTNSWV